MKVKEFINKLDYAMCFLRNDEMFGDMFEQGYFEDHSTCKLEANLGECILCVVGLPYNKITLNDLLECHKEFLDYEKSFNAVYESYLSSW